MLQKKFIFLKKEFDTYIKHAYKPASPMGWMTFQGQFENRIEESDREKWAIGCKSNQNIKCLKIERFKR